MVRRDNHDETDAAVWSSRQGADSDTSVTSPVPDLLRPGLVPVANPDFARDDINPWGDAKQNSASSQSVDQSSQVPQSLQPGVARKETNPFKKKPVPNRSRPQDVPASLTVPSRPPPSSTTPPATSFSQMRLDESENNPNPWQPALDDRASTSRPPAPPPTLSQESNNNVWGSGQVSGEATRSVTPATIPMQKTGDSAPWADETPPRPSLPPMPVRSTAEQNQLSDDQHAWDDAPSSTNGRHPAAATHPGGDKWNLIDHEPTPQREAITISRQSSWENFMDTDDGPANPSAHPPARTVSPPSSHAPVSAAVVEPSSPPSPPPQHSPRTNTAPQPQVQSQSQTARPPPKSDTYQIKNVNWYDAKLKKTRKSPILVQNVNGPCPLVALVNALTLTTSPTATSNLVETLRSREQVSISFLLEAVIDELMSSGRRDPDADLPDMSELYDFLKGLQTGMNVNPRFLPSPEAATKYKRTSLSHVHPHERDDLVPGTFEQTKDMVLYATFSIPLLHGWLPPRDDPVYDAFGRQTASYDDVQSLLFREEELEFKLSTTAEGLTEPEQQLYQDILTIKSWLSSTATQLTSSGLDVVTKSIQPGGVAILFRNDHFATLYRHPQTLELLTLVTDAGYHKHDEVIWESLVDVRGENSDFYSGDFRVVGGSQQQQSSSGTQDQGGEWQTVQGRRGNNGSSSQHSVAQTSGQELSQAEQEDRDLAFALQLQEEEEQRQRDELAAHRHQSELSEQFIEQQGQNGQHSPNRGDNSRVSVPLRGPGSTTGTTTGSSRSPRTTSQPQAPVRSLIPPRTNRPGGQNAGDDAPPTYEQASQSTPYAPPAGHPNHATSSPSTPRRPPGQPSMAAAAPGYPGATSPMASGGAGRGRHPGMVPAGPQGSKEEKCVVM
ncbi:ubiquitin carboxyl-terminal hydrolase MINDY-1/2 [Microdochium nivale]|nr:ubiquitin carboxyl-terminal hydrolase MINDY-1/2 [Microdochium nivale]